MAKYTKYDRHAEHLSWSEDDDGNNNRRTRGNKNSGGPPELEELFKKVQKWLVDLMGNKSSNSQKPGSNGGNKYSLNYNLDQQGKFFLVVIGFISVLLLAIMGFYKVEPGEQAVQYRFGKYIGTTGPGPHWILPGIYSKEIINTSVIHQKNFEEDLITKEVDLVTVAVAVQYRINNIEHFLFKVSSAEESLSEATKSAIRQVVAESTLEQVLSTRGSTENSFMGDQIKNLIDQNLKYYQAGLEINGVEILSVQPPQQVKEAFNDAIQAQEDEIRYQNEAEAYERKIVPVAEGNAARLIQDANTYVSQITLAAEGDVSKFNAILPEYAKAPQVTRNRLYIGAIENGLRNTPKIIIDSKSNNALVLPLDKLNLAATLKATQSGNSSTNNKALLDNAEISINENKQVSSNLSPARSERSESRAWRN
ncbi:MAG: FtsH protease activity modulator HflK [Gammaproteobacteria bacterium]|nr:FtsH protease activity modulator HflK [Gammaproteobacteria bacterium]